MYCVLILMATPARHYGAEGIEVREVTQVHDLPLVAVKGIVEQLGNSGLIVEKEDGEFSLKIPPEKKANIVNI